MKNVQWLVRFGDSTYVVGNDEVLETLERLTGWDVNFLEISHRSYPFVSVRVRSSIRGGKGGFGTLLKGQSKQAGANLTTDFGACRDLQGRRLRHLNDEIKLRKWRDIQKRKQAGERVKEENEYMNTPSGIYNWYLMVPSWANISGKATRKLQLETKRQFEYLATEKEKRQAEREERERLHNYAVKRYVQQSMDATENLGVGDAIRQGLLAAKKRKRIDEESDPPAAEVNDGDEEMTKSSIVTISGEFILDEDASIGWTVQSLSDFATLCLVLEGKPDAPLYFEVCLETGGLSQIGWADLSQFQPEDESGNGVGDDQASFAYDGSRRLKFHADRAESYGEEWKSGDIVGCRYDTRSGKISYQLNGLDLGLAFETSENRALVPSLSTNKSEILQIRTQRSQMQYMPEGCIAIKALMENSSSEQGKSATSPTSQVDVSSKTAGVSEGSSDPAPLDSQAVSTTKRRQTFTEPEPLEIEKYQSIEELKELGLDRLKSALMAIGAKCGGSLDERAVRLFSLKGLEWKDFPAKVRAKNFVAKRKTSS